MSRNPSPLYSRRHFLRSSFLGASAALTLPTFLERTFLSLDAAAAEAPGGARTGRDAPILVVVQLAGGNDGLNTLAPYADDVYRRARPGLGLTEANVLKLDGYCGLHPALRPLREIYDAGGLGIVQGAGYPNPNRSHFRSTEIWQTAGTDDDPVRGDGWLGKYFDHNCAGADPTVGVAVGNESPQAFASARPTGVTLSRPEQYRWRSQGGDGDGKEKVFREMNRPDGGDDDFGGAGAADGSSIGMLGGGGRRMGGSPLDFLQRVGLDAQLSSDKIREIARKFPATANYPQGKLADGLHLVARLIAGGLPTRVFYVSQGGYDTHNNQQGAHERLLTELSGSLAAFYGDIKAQGRLDQVMVLTFSEFGRRLEENGSGGTDHGAAAPMFLMGGGVKAGLHGRAPSLTDLDRGDLRHTVDFRSVYATVLERWLGVPSAPVLGKAFGTLPILA